MVLSIMIKKEKKKKCSQKDKGTTVFLSFLLFHLVISMLCVGDNLADRGLLLFVRNGMKTTRTNNGNSLVLSQSS